MAIPVTLILGRLQETERPTSIRKLPVPQRMRSTLVKSRKPVIPPIKKVMAKRLPTIIPSKPTRLSSSKNQKPRAQAKKPIDKPAPSIDRLALIFEEPSDEPLEMRVEGPAPITEQDLETAKLPQEGQDQEWNMGEATSFLDAPSPAMGRVDGNPGDGGSQNDRIDQSPIFGVQYAHMAKPEYPWRARRMGWEGTTLLRVLVDQQGHSKSVLISRSSGFDNLDSAAVKAVKGWRFNPARSRAGPVESWVKIPIVFTLKKPSYSSIVNSNYANEGGPD